MKRILLTLSLCAVMAATVGCSQKAKWNHEQRKALRNTIMSYREMVYLQDLSEPEFAIFTDDVAGDIETAYPAYATFMQLPAADDTLDMFVVTAIVEQLSEDAKNMRHLYPYHSLVRKGILPDKLTHEQRHAFYQCLAQKVNNYYNSSIADFVSDVLKSDASSQTQINRFQSECANELFDWVIEVTEVDVIEPASSQPTQQKK